MSFRDVGILEGGEYKKDPGRFSHETNTGLCLVLVYWSSERSGILVDANSWKFDARDSMRDNPFAS